MHSPLSRRAWLGRSAMAFGLAALPEISDVWGIESLGRKGAARMRLSLAAYSFRDFFKEADRKREIVPAPGQGIDILDFVDYCADHGCDGAELTSYYFPKETDQGYLLKLKRHAFLRGIAISGGAVGNTFTHPAGPAREKEMAGVKKWIDYCAILGAPHLRVFAGAPQDKTKPEASVANCIEALKVACDYAGQKGIFLGIENHGGIVEKPGPLLDIIKAVDSPWLGINLDTGNFHTADPYADFALCIPYAVNVQLKTEVEPAGVKEKQRADIKRYIRLLREGNYQGYVALEFEEKADPYKSIPGVLEEMTAAMQAS